MKKIVIVLLLKLCGCASSNTVVDTIQTTVTNWKIGDEIEDGAVDFSFAIKTGTKGIKKLLIGKFQILMNVLR